jgi:predicted metal-binding membrane protein
VSAVSVTARPAMLGRLERAAWHYPEWTWAALAVACWALLAALHLRGWGPFGAHNADAAQHSVHVYPAGDGGHQAMHHVATSSSEAPLQAGAHTTSWLAAQGGWLLMATAMMLPSALPTARHVAMNSRWQRRQRATAIFMGTYLAVWLLFGVVVVSVARWTPVPKGVEWPLAATLVVAAGWELTPAKRRWLRACHRTVPLPPSGWKADAACARFGLRYGQACIGACWALMLPMAIAGHAGLPLMTMLTAIVAAEEVMVKGVRLVRSAGVVLVIAAAVVAAVG